MNDRPVRVLGAASRAAEEVFSNVEGVILLSGGAIAVADRSSSEVRVFDLDGTHKATMGGAGDGPGEFRWLGWIDECSPGTLAAYDVRLGRLTTFDVERLTHATHRLPTIQGVPPRTLRCLGEGYLGVFPRFDGDPPRSGGPTRGTVLLRAINEDLIADLESSVQRAGEELYFWAADGELGPRPLGKKWTVASHGRAFVVGTQDEPRLLSFNASGQLLRVLEWPGEPRPLTDADRTRSIEDRVARERSPEVQRLIRSRYQSAPDLFPPTVPVHGELLVDDQDHIWVESMPRREDGVRWEVFGDEGRWLGGVMFPSGFRPMTIRGSLVGGVWRSELGEEQVWVLALNGRS